MCVESGGSSDWETAKTWNFFGDPSLQARTETPLDITLTSDLIMVGIPFTTTVTSIDGPVENAMVTLSQGDLFFTGITDASGSVSIEQALNPGTAKLVVTGLIRKRFMKMPERYPAKRTVMSPSLPLKSDDTKVMAMACLIMAKRYT